MKKNTIFLLLVLVSLSLTAQKKPSIKGNKLVSEISRVIPEKFNALEVDDGLEITLEQGSDSRYHLITDDNLVDIVKISVRDSILHIYTTHKINSSKKLEISLTVAALEHIILKNDAKVKGKGRLDSDRMYLSAYNSSGFDLDLKADDITVSMHRNSGGKLKCHSENLTINMNDRSDLKANASVDIIRVTLNKSAQLNLDGDGEYGAFNLKDSSELDARGMKVQAADLYTSNTSDVYVHARKNLELYAQGKSNIYVYGNPQVDVKGLTDKSKIIKK